MIQRDTEDCIQSLAFTGFGSLPHTVLLRVRDIDRAWLNRVLPHIAFGRAHYEIGVQLLLTARGLAAVGAKTEDVARIGRELLHGMTYAPSRQRIGDKGVVAQDSTWWTDQDHDAVLLLYGRSFDALKDIAADLTRGVAQVGNAELRVPNGGREHFGFLDGITRTRIARSGKSEKQALPPGTFVFGQPDASGNIVDVGPLGQNGSLAVVREFSQDVRSFWTYWREVARGDEHTAVLYAAKAVGRWPNGMPILPGHTSEPPFDEGKLDLGTFAHDRKGTGCPFGSHVRRSNPRDGLIDDGNVSLQISAQHTILRRGRLFGPSAPAAWYPAPLRDRIPTGTDATADAPRGLMFIGLCTDIRRQFEFIVQNWLLAPKFGGLLNEVDPLLAQTDTPRTFTIQTDGFAQHLHGVGGWVRPRGGGYYLLPAHGALERLAGQGGAAAG